MPSIRDGGEHLYWHYFLIRGFYVNDTYRQVLMNRLGGLVVIAPVRRAGDPGSNPGPGDNFFS